MTLQLIICWEKKELWIFLLKKKNLLSNNEFSYRHLGKTQLEREESKNVLAFLLLGGWIFKPQKTVKTIHPSYSYECTGRLLVVVKPRSLTEAKYREM